MEQPDIRALPGLVATVSTTGAVTPQFAENLSNLRSYNDTHGLIKVEYKTMGAVLVEAGRDACVQHMMKEKYEWLLQIDADAAPFPQDALERMLQIAYLQMPHVRVVGGYCQIKGPVPLPTIDTGTGTWEEHYPGEGILSCIRTGAHFFLCKRDAFAGTGPPWFRSRVATTPLRAMMEVDNYARVRLDGNNPLADLPEWDTLMHAAYKGTYGETHVGEDSGFFDKLRAIGKMVVVDCDLVVGHVSTKIIMPIDLKEAMNKRLVAQRTALGIYS